MLLVSAYDYLGLVGHPVIERAAVAAIHEFGTGTGGVRMLTGTTALHGHLERELAEFLGTEAALTFSSGYLANLAVVAALVGPRDRVLADDRVHRSLHDACRLARVPTIPFPHNDLAGLERELARGASGGRTLIVVDGVYSMDGDLCPLPDLVALKRKYGAFLLVDEAHALGAVGPTGRGTREHFGVPANAVDVWTGSLSKAIPSNGGFLAGSTPLVLYLQHAGTPFWFSAALCPAAAATAREALRVITAEPHRVAQLQRSADTLRDGLRARGFDVGASESAIIPAMTRNEDDAWKLTRALYARGVLASAVVYPAVARGAARLRICATAAFTGTDLRETLDAFHDARGDLAA
jgi:glycine C-acetyltransferase